jgi:L-alanine-DL-glutamate epimerase-like enolase superfamily enzyme
MAGGPESASSGAFEPRAVEAGSDAASGDRIIWAEAALVVVPLGREINDAKVLTGRQRPLTAVDLLVVQIKTAQEQAGLGFSYTLRTGGPAMLALAKELAEGLLGEDPNDISRLWDKLSWWSASSGRGGLAGQVIAAFDIALWDLKARRAGLPLAKLLGAQRDSVRCYNTSGGYLSSDLDEMKERASASLARGIGGIKMKVGQPDPRLDLRRIDAMRSHLGASVPLMIDANQQWDRTTALRFGRIVEPFDLVWIEEPLDAHDFEGHAALATELATPIATGEMLTSVDEHLRLIEAGGADFLQADAPRVGGITPFLKVCARAEQEHLQLAPHFVMEVHLHLAATYASEPWVEHFEWLEPVFEERFEIRSGRMIVPDRPGLGLTLSEATADWTHGRFEVALRS